MAKKLETTQHEFVGFENINDEVVGKITKFFDIPTRFGNQTVIEICTKEGELKCIGCTTNLQLYLGQLQENDILKVVYAKNEKNPKTRNTYKVFDVYILEENEF